MYTPQPMGLHPDDVTYNEANSILTDHRFGISNLCFDTQDLLWMGNQGVSMHTAHIIKGYFYRVNVYKQIKVSSWFENSLAKYY